jgi:Ferric reductase like transmembrane component/Ferric reductase NAD binding domain/FAD-binding domain
MTAVPRHEGHDETGSHYANVIYGYEFFLLSGVTLILLSIRNSVAPAFIKKYGFALTVPKWLGAVLWLFVVFAFCASGTTPTLSGIAKRVGRITYSILPLTLFLSLRPSPLPKTYYVKLVFLHKWISRTVVLTGTVHGSLYITHFIRGNEAHKIFKFDNFLGICALTCLYTIAISSLLPIRLRQYKYFYMIHYPLAWVVLIIGIFHARPGVSLLAFWSIFMLLAQAAYKGFTARTVTLEVNDVSSTLQIVNLRRELLPDYFDPGSHIRLSLPLWNPISWIVPSHPYTIASMASDDEVKLVVRKTRFSLSPASSYSLTGPYAPSSSAELTATADKVLVFAGGSGISFAAPIVRAMVLKGARVKLVWIIKDRVNLPVLESLGITEGAIFVTGGGTASSEDLYGDTIGLLSKESRYDTTMNEDDVEFHELLDRRSDSIDIDEDDEGQSSGSSTEGRTLVNGADEDLRKLNRGKGGEEGEEGEEDEDSFAFERPSTASVKSNLDITYGRPIFSNVSQGFITEGDKGSSRVWAVACGPRTLVQDVEKWASQSGIRFTGEKYFL